MTQQHVLILQGGGALGAYQGGVYQQLFEHHDAIDWVIGTSIGAINAAIIAGNPPENRVEQLHAFWQSLSQSPMDPVSRWASITMPWLTPVAAGGSWRTNGIHGAISAINTVDTMMTGVQGFFKPRVGASWNIQAKVPLSETGFYDTSPLKTTLEQYVDFDYLNNGVMRLSVCAVDLDSGQSVVFDTQKQRITPEHIMASGALPPGFPAIEIDGRAYWDGGVYSNSPLDVFLEEGANRDALCFMIDLWNPNESRPTSIAETLTRYKDIQYASRSVEQLRLHRKSQDLQRAIRALGQHLPADVRSQPEVQELLHKGCEHTINVIHLVMKALACDNSFKDIDFSQSTVDTRWNAGMEDCHRALRHKSWLQPLPPHAGLIIHELKPE